MSAKIFSHNEENAKNVQAGNAVSLINGGVVAICAICGTKNPEYALDDKQLCLDCYKSEVEH